jgi:hypothetical protein
VQSEGGTVEEIVCEENGILISAMLRQYFMSLRTVGQWKKLARCWSDVAERVAARQSFVASRPTTAASRASRDEAGEGGAKGSTPRTWDEFLQRRKGAAAGPADGDEESDDDDAIATTGGEEEEEAEQGRGALAGGDATEQDLERMDWELLLIRKFFGRWADKAGVRREVCDAAEAEAESIDWTRVVAPVVEGRIRMVGA